MDNMVKQNLDTLEMTGKSMKILQNTREMDYNAITQKYQ